MLAVTTYVSNENNLVETPGSCKHQPGLQTSPLLSAAPMAPRALLAKRSAFGGAYLLAKRSTDGCAYNCAYSVLWSALA